MPPASEFTVRPARHQDISAITGMARSLADAMGLPPERADKDAIAQLLFGGDRWAEAFVAVDRDHRLVGYVTVSRRFEPHCGRRALWLGDLYVMLSVRRQGVGRALFGAAAKRAVALKCDALVWNVAEDDEAARRFFGECAGKIRMDAVPFELTGNDLLDAAQG